MKQKFWSKKEKRSEGKCKHGEHTAMHWKSQMRHAMIIQKEFANIMFRMVVAVLSLTESSIRFRFRFLCFSIRSFFYHFICFSLQFFPSFFFSHIFRIWLCLSLLVLGYCSLVGWNSTRTHEQNTLIALLRWFGDFFLLLFFVRVEN